MNKLHASCSIVHTMANLLSHRELTMVYLLHRTMYRRSIACLSCDDEEEAVLTILSAYPCLLERYSDFMASPDAIV